ncbi:outer membrane beta-barrel protein [Helicobacter pylori]|uniref:Hop family adhesin HopQ n=1 Tax=Helicobacter pylori TaxID=210 RepID=UPI0011C7D991|nr:Hop family adhesin HopQ [Helicobacter pylori]NHB13051.1 outer membrane beta-barrel protein [Helicobacter pylori]QEF38452.1 outer membrane beta-barrel protein [Helicobacter pylori]
MKKTKKTILLSLTLASSLLHAEDNGVFLSVGYQIGEAVQKVKNADKVQKLSDTYEQLSRLLTNDSGTNSKTSAQAINQAVNNLNERAKTLAGGTTNSPAYQATLLALRSVLGLWNSMGYAVICGGYTKSPGENNQKNFHYTDENGNGTTINCGGSTNSNGSHSSSGTNTLRADKGVSLSIKQYEDIHEAYQILSKALKQAGLAPLNSKGEKLKAHVTTSKYQLDNQTKTTTSVIDTTNDAQNLLNQAQTIINTLQDQCPMLIGKSTSGSSGANSAPSWQTSSNLKSCEVFSKEFSAASDMIKNAQKIVQETQQLNANQPKNITQPNNFNLNTPSSLTALAQKMLKNAQSQAEILKLANQVESDFNKLYSGHLKNYIGKCDASAISSVNMTMQNQKNNWGNGCAGVEETLTSLKASTTDFNNQTTPQLDQAQTLANTLIQELGNNPFKRVGMIGSQTNNGAMNGFGVQAGYKQFFGQKRRWGLRYYGFFDYNHTYIKSSFFNSASDVWTYGVGSDLLFNFINDKNTNFLGKNNKISVGLFGGIALAGTSWLNSQFVNLKTISNVYSAKVNTANFQFLFNLGLRTNLARPKKKDSDHSAQHGMELGVKIPTINTNYYSYLGTKLEYRRLYSVYLNYVFAY